MPDARCQDGNDACDGTDLLHGEWCQAVKPYYEDEWVTIYHGDCLDLLPHRSAATRTRQVEVAPGNDQDVCPLCGIWRMNAGWITATCGTYLRKPGCFVVPLLTGRHPRKPGGDTVALHD